MYGVSCPAATAFPSDPVRVYVLVRVPTAACPAARMAGYPSSSSEVWWAAWLERVAAVGEPGVSVTVVRFDQRQLRLVLHAGSIEPGGAGWLHGDAVGSGEVHKLAAAFSGGFRFSTGAGGFVENGRVGAVCSAAPPQSSPTRTGAATSAHGESRCQQAGSPVPPCARACAC